MFDWLKPFSWEREFKKKKFHITAKSRAWEFMHELDVPITLVGRVPKDLNLFNLCVDFRSAVNSNDMEEAKQLYDDIQERVKYINAQGTLDNSKE